MQSTALCNIIRIIGFELNW